MNNALKQEPCVAVAGCGHWGQNLVRNFASLGALKALCDTDTARATAMAAQYNVPHLSWQQVLADKGIKAVVIAAPAVRHFSMAKEALEAGKDVMVEKPLALDAAEGEVLCKMAQERRQILMVGHVLHYHSAYQKLKALIQQGELGTLRYIYSNRLNLGKIRREEDILWSFAPHDISMILDLMGEEPQNVSAEAGFYLSGNVADVTTTHLTFSGGRKAHIFLSWLHPFKEQKLVVVGTKAMAVFNDGEPWQSKLQIFRHSVTIDENNIPVANKAPAENVALEESEPLKAECAAFLASMQSRQAPVTDGREGLGVLRVLQLATQHIQKGQKPMDSVNQTQKKKDYFAHETAVIDSGAVIGSGSKIWHFAHVLGGTVLGRNVTVGQNVMIGPDVMVGDECKIQNNVSLYKGVVLEEGVFCGPSCVFTNVKTPRARIERKEEFLKTPVGKNATIGANATIICGNTIGAYAMIGAGAVVTHDVPAHAIVFGNPARQKGWCSHAGEILGPDLTCPREGRVYKIIDGNLVEQKTGNAHGKAAKIA